MRINTASDRLLSGQRLTGITKFSHTGIIDIIGARSRGAYIDGKSDADSGLSCTAGTYQSCGCCSDDGPPYYNCLYCAAYLNEVIPYVLSGSFSSDKYWGYQDVNHKGFKSFAASDHFMSTDYTWITCAGCATVADADSYGNSAASQGDTVVYINMGDAAYAGIKESDGSLWTWGNTESGKLGQNSATNTKSPIQVGSDAWTMVAAGNAKILSVNIGVGGSFAAIKSDGTLWSWGNNYYGQLGDNSTTNRSSPVQVSGGGSWKYVACGVGTTYAIKSDGTLWAWGKNTYGEVGDNSTTSRSSPVQVSGGGSWKYVAGGDKLVLAIKENGTMWGWGYNNYSAIGDFTSTNRSSPVQVGNTGWTDWTHAAIDSVAKSYGIRANGTAWAWGFQPYGLSTGTYTSPNQIGTKTKYFVSCSINPSGAGTYVYNQPGPAFITNIGNVVQIQGFTSAETVLYSGSYATQLILPTNSYGGQYVYNGPYYYPNAWLMKNVPA